MNGTACVLFNLITESVGMLIVYLQMEPVECLEECLFSPRVENQPKVHLQNVLITL